MTSPTGVSLFPTGLSFGAPRQEQLKELSSEVDTGDEVSTISKIDRDLMISSLSVGFATAGALFYSPLSLLSVPGLAWITVVNCEDAYEGFQKGRGISIYCLRVKR